MWEVLDATLPLLPAHRPRYLMGVGTPRDIIRSVALGVDMFDCVLPTRNARNGCLFTSEGRILIKECGLCRRRSAARPGLLMPDLPALHASLPAAPVHVRRAPFGDPEHDAQRVLLS